MTRAPRPSGRGTRSLMRARVRRLTAFPFCLWCPPQLLGGMRRGWLCGLSTRSQIENSVQFLLRFSRSTTTVVSSWEDRKLVEKDASLERFNLEAAERAAELKTRQNEAPLPPSVRSLCLDHTLYAAIQLNPVRDDRFLSSVKFGAQQFDAHCVYCGQDATFRTSIDRKPSDVAHAERLLGLAGGNEQKRLTFEGGQFALHLWCSRRPQHHLYSYFFDYNQGQSILTKVGQTPSLEDIAGADLERYRAILGKEFAEMRRATGLFAHGIGIGSFVYLRRIFERLVEAARSTADPTGEREADFRKLRMADRVSELADYLPPAVVKYKDAYGILSLGLHELTEAECKRYFPAVRAAVIMMLEQKYEAAEKAKITAELDRAVAAIANETKGQK